MLAELFRDLSSWYMEHMNYASITGLMAIESSFIPLPSEVVIPPAAWKAAEGELNIYLVVLFGTIGATIGALFNYVLAMTLGRKVIYALADSKVAKLMLINSKKVEHSEEYFRKYGNVSTFIGRLIPGVRHLISIPAGLSRMNLKFFVLFTFLGALIWNIILAILGHLTYTQKDLLDKWMHEISYVLLGVGVVAIAIIGWKIYKSMKKENKE